MNKDEGACPVTGDTVEAANAAYRRKRVKRIKKIIIGTCIFLLIMPTLLAVFLMIKVYSLENEIQKISENKAREQQETSSAIVQAKEKKQQEASQTAEPQTKKVYLTFDDGPGVQTEKILKILKKQNVKATFFVTGKEDASSKKIYKKIVKDGHTLGMHSYSHNCDTIYDTKEAFEKDFNQLYNYLYDVTGVYPKFYRFPGGSSNQSTELPIQTFIDVLNEKGVIYQDWNVISPDISNSNVTKKQIVNSIMESVAQYDTSIVLMYDVADKPMTVKALPSIIKALKAENYELLPIDEDTPLVQHNNSNQEDKK